MEQAYKYSLLGDPLVIGHRSTNALHCIFHGTTYTSSPRNLFCAPHAPPLSVSVSVLLLLLLSPPVALPDFATLTSTGLVGWLAPDLAGLALDLGVDLGLGLTGDLSLGRGRGRGLRLGLVLVLMELRTPGRDLGRK